MIPEEMIFPERLRQSTVEAQLFSYQQFRRTGDAIVPAVEDIRLSKLMRCRSQTLQFRIQVRLMFGLSRNIHRWKCISREMSTARSRSWRTTPFSHPLCISICRIIVPTRRVVHLRGWYTGSD